MNYSKEENTKRKKSQKSNKKKAKNKVGIIVFRVIFIGVLALMFAVGGALIGAYAGVIENAPLLEDVITLDGARTTIVYSAETGQELDRFDGGENREIASFSEVPQSLKDAFVAIEDERFYSHDGVDFRGLARATYVTLTTDETQGASTLTQQLIKNKLGYNRNTIETKLQEQYLAIEYEKNLTAKLGSKNKAKDTILQDYMNSIGLGRGQVGVKAAAKYYYNKNVSDLTLAESASIAAITQNPTKYNPEKNPDENVKRRDKALDKMLELGMITQNQYDEALKDDIYSRITAGKDTSEDTSPYHSYFNDSLLQQVIDDLQEQKGMSKTDAEGKVYYGGLEIYSTEDTRIQKIMETEFMDESNFPSVDYTLDVVYFLSTKNSVTGKESHYEEKTIAKSQEQVDAFTETTKENLLGESDDIIGERVVVTPQPQSSMIIMDQYTGHVKALVGGRGEKSTDRGFNRATQALRQHGSVFKILASFAPAIDMGTVTAASVYVDEPYTYTAPGVKYSPNNWYKGYRGRVTVRDAIRDSMNIITVKVMIDAGIENVMNYMYNFGFKNIGPTDHVPAASLGGVNGVTQLEVVGAYASIANSGKYNRPVFYTKVIEIVNGEEVVLLETVPEQNQVLKSTTAYIVTDMMKDVVKSGTGQAANFKNMSIAAKTGTTSDSKDLALAGYTPYYTAAIWLGNDNNKPMNSKITSDHSRLWGKIMAQVHENLENKDFPKPEGITTASICRDSGKLPIYGLCDADPRGSRIKSEIFAIGTVPTESCDYHTEANTLIEGTEGVDLDGDGVIDVIQPIEGEVVDPNNPNANTGQPTITDPQLIVPETPNVPINIESPTNNETPTEAENNIDTGPSGYISGE